MFINSGKCFEICEGDQKLVIPCGYIGEIPEWAAGHWMVQAAIRDGSIATPTGRTDRALEAAESDAAEKAETHDIRPEEIAKDMPEPKDPEKPGNKKGKA